MKDGAGLYTGGICGNMNPTDSTKVYNCVNNGNITGVAITGGIVGILAINATTMNCSNDGRIESIQRVAGGIVGQMNQKNSQSYSVVQECYNSGEIAGTNGLGGIVGWLGGETEQGTVKKCYSKGSISNTAEESGAIVGKQIRYGVNVKYENLYYLNTIGLYAINNQEQYNTDNIKAVEDDIKTYSEFIKWINNL